MADELNPVPGADPAATAAAPTPDPAPVNPAVDPAPAPAADPVPVATDPAAPPAGSEEPPVNPNAPAWAKKRIDELTRKRHDAERAAQAAAEAARKIEEENRQLRELMAAANLAPPAGGGPAPTAQPAAPVAGFPAHWTPDQINAEINRRAQQQAQEQAAIAQFTAACNAVAEKGKAEFKDFDEKLGNLHLLGVTQNHAFLRVATSVPDGHRVLRYLGANPDIAERIAAMDPISMATEMTRLSMQPTLRPAISAAPPPPTPVGARPAAPEVSTDNAKNMGDFASAWRKRRSGGR